jgi:hypothetical protein
MHVGMRLFNSLSRSISAMRVVPVRAERRYPFTSRTSVSRGGSPILRDSSSGCRDLNFRATMIRCVSCSSGQQD